MGNRSRNAKIKAYVGAVDTILAPMNVPKSIIKVFLDQLFSHFGGFLQSCPYRLKVNFKTTYVWMERCPPEWNYNVLDISSIA